MATSVEKRMPPPWCADLRRCEHGGEDRVSSPEHIFRSFGRLALSAPSEAAGRAAAGLGARGANIASRGALAATDALLRSEFLDELADRVLDSPAAERLVARVIEGPLFDKAVARLLESEDLWILVDEIARSPAVTEAIGRQGASFADQFAGAVRDRSLNADERLEVAVRGLMRRRRRRPRAAPGEGAEA
jgi:hypothetical protein